MSATMTERMKREAVNIVLERLGTEMFEVVKFHLKRSYAISLNLNDDSSLSLDQLHFGLSVILGEGHANNLLSQVVREIKEMPNKETHA